MSIIVEQRAGIDWLSATLLIDAPESAAWVRKCQIAIETIAEGGYRIENRSMLGYSGFSAGNCFIGANNDRYFLQLTGYHAGIHFNAVYRGDLHISRVDLQVSVKFDVMPANIAKKGYKDANNSNDGLSAHRRRKIHIIIGSDGGDTLYVGSPSSEQRGRIYNKEVQSQDVAYERTWRYEVVYKNAYATDVCYNLHKRGIDASSYTTTLVGLWFEARGIEAPWIFDSALVTLPLIKTLPSDVERTLLWLSEQVAPSVARLCDLGYRDTILALLPGLAVHDTE